MSKPFADRLAALVEERRSQVCLGLDPDPAQLPAAGVSDSGASAAERAAKVLVGSTSTPWGEGGSPELLGAAFSAGPASAIVAASRGIAAADDPAAAAEKLREEVWRVATE